MIIRFVPAQVKLPVDSFNLHGKDGGAASRILQILEATNPEAAAFTESCGEPCGLMACPRRKTQANDISAGSSDAGFAVIVAVAGSAVSIDRTHCRALAPKLEPLIRVWTADRSRRQTLR